MAWPASAARLGLAAARDGGQLSSGVATGCCRLGPLAHNAGSGTYLNTRRLQIRPDGFDGGDGG